MAQEKNCASNEALSDAISLLCDAVLQANLAPPLCNTARYVVGQLLAPRSAIREVGISDDAEKTTTLDSLLAEQKRTNELLAALLAPQRSDLVLMRIIGEQGHELEQIRRATERARSRLGTLLELGSRLRRGWSR